MCIGNILALQGLLPLPVVLPCLQGTLIFEDRCRVGYIKTEIVLNSSFSNVSMLRITIGIELNCNWIDFELSKKYGR